MLQLGRKKYFDLNENQKIKPNREESEESSAGVSPALCLQAVPRLSRRQQTTAKLANWTTLQNSAKQKKLFVCFFYFWIILCLNEKTPENYQDGL